MAEFAGEDDTILKEWAPLTDLFQKLPTKTQSGLFTADLKLTCVDVITEFIVVGTNCGAVYCYDRKKKDLQRLRCENPNSAITAVKITSTVDYMLACGNKDGNISIFQIPKAPPDNLPESLRPKNKQVERYTVSEMHKGFISSLEWSKNGMKLFSGDSNGLVILTEIDFYMHLCKSIEILNEAYEVVQLSYHTQQLLVSTTYRSIVCQKQEKWKVSQVGRKDRKILGQFGGVFYQNGIRPSDIVLYCSRPGLRVWVSDTHGSVQQTLLFKDLLNVEFPEVPILNPLPSNLKRLKPTREASFGPIYPFCEELLVTYNNDMVYVLSPKDLKVVATVSHLRGVLDVSVNKDEIFILEGERSLLRVAFTPDIQKESSCTSTNSFTPISTSIRELTNKIRTTTIVPAIPPLFESSKTSEQTDTTTVIHAEEARESPTRVTSINKLQPLDQSYLERVHEAYRKQEIYDKISEQEFDETILFKRKKSDFMMESICSSSSNSSDERDANITKPTVMNISTIGMLPDFRSPTSIQHDIEVKEKKLANLLNFDQVKIDLKQLQKKCDTINIYDAGSKCDNVVVLSNRIIIHGNEKKDVVDDTPKIKPINTEESIPISTKIVENGVPNGVKCEIPVCKTVPATWKLNEVTLQIDSNDESFNDWEII